VVVVALYPHRDNNQQGLIMASARELKSVLTTKEFGKAVGLATDTVKIYCQRGLIAATKIGGRHGTWLIPKCEIKRYRKKRKAAGRPTGE